MGHWLEDDVTYVYSQRELRRVAYYYTDYAKSGPPRPTYKRQDIERDRLSSKIDFDRALDAIGRGHWSGTHFVDSESRFRDYRSFGEMQQIVIADIMFDEMVVNTELERRGFYDVDRQRRKAYRAMANWLNGKRT